MDYPKLRYGIEAFPVEHAGRQMLLLRDRLGFCSSSLLVSIQVAPILMQMDGTNSLRDLQAWHMRRRGELITIEQFQELVGKLDEYLFLENARFLEAAAKEVARFRDDPVRRMRHAGQSYSSEPEELRGQLNDFFSPENGGPGVPAKGSDGRRLIGLVAPHIDIKAGGPSFAGAYKAAVEAGAVPKTWVVLGTGHEPVENLFALTSKDFETPLGLIHADRDACAELLRRAPRDLSAGEYNHNREHTIEFQAVFLSRFFPESRIVPLLCGFSCEEREADRGYVDEVAGILRDMVLRSRGSMGVIASVDLAHVGPRYGDRFRPDEGTIRQHMAADRDLLARLEQCDAEGFMRIIASDGNARKVCGVAPLFMMASILAGECCGTLLHHGYATVDEQDSFVTFAGMAFYQE